MKPRTKTFNPRAVIAQAEGGALTLKEVRAAIRTAEQFNNRDAGSRLREIEQRMLGERATRRLSNDHTYGSAAWAFAEFSAVPKTPYSWAAIDREGHVVVTLWDDHEGWTQDGAGRWYPLHPYGARPDATRDAAQSERETATRTEFFRLMEVAVASHGGLVRAILCSAEDVHAHPRKRISGSSRPWLNDDGSPVRLGITSLDLGAKRFGYALADEGRRPRSPFQETGPRLSSAREDRMLRAFAERHPGRYYLEVTVGERRVDAVRIPGTSTDFHAGASFRPEMGSGCRLEVIEVKQGMLRRDIVDQTIGSATALGGIPVAIVEKAAPGRLTDLQSRYPSLQVWVTTGR